MYKLLLCWRYLRTRYIALASIVSVTLGVATMIVVNSVMAGFTHEMQDRIRGILADVTVEARSFDGVRDPAAHMAKIREIAGQYIEAMTPTVHVPAMVNFKVNGQWATRPVQLIGIDAETINSTSRFSEYLQHPSNREKFSFNLRDGDYDVLDHQGGDDPAQRPAMRWAGWPWRKERVWRERELEQRMLRANEAEEASQAIQAAGEKPKEDADNDSLTASVEAEEEGRTSNPFDARPPEQADVHIFDPAQEQSTGCVVGMALTSFRRSGENVDHFLALPGDDVKLTFPTAGTPPSAVSDTFTIVDFYESKMSEYDGSFIFLPIEKLQQLRGMVDPADGTTYVSSIQIKLKDPSQGVVVRNLLQEAFAPELYSVQTWQDKQGPLLAAVQTETAILNILLFFIIAVAGFGILAIFFMIVVEKTKDIGILKSLGAHAGGVMGIFLGYGLLLGAVGSGAGMAIGLWFVANINWIRDKVSETTGADPFNPDVYYFYEIPTIVHPFTVAWIVGGAMLIAILASVLPAFRASRLHPVEALRYE